MKGQRSSRFGIALIPFLMLLSRSPVVYRAFRKLSEWRSVACSMLASF